MSASQSLEDFDDSDGSVSDDNHVYSESEAEDEDGDHEPLPDVNDILKSGKTWDMLSLHEKFNVWYNVVASNAQIDTKKLILRQFGVGMIADEQEEGMEDSALHHADNQEIACMIIEAAGKNLSKQVICYLDEKNLSPLHTAAWHGFEDVVTYLLSFDIPEEELLFLEECIEQELSEEQIYHEPKGNTALHYAANQKVAEILVNAVSEENRKDFIWISNSADLTALHVACWKGKPDLVKYYLSLVEFGKEFNMLYNELIATGLFNGTLLHFARTREVARIVEEFVRERCREDQTNEFISYAGGFDRETALHTASKQGRTGVVKYLLTLDEPMRSRLINAKDRMESFPLHMSRNRRIAKSLLSAIPTDQRISYMEATNDAKQTPLLYAAQTGRSEVVKFFLDNFELNVTQTDIDGNTLLHAAIDGGHAETAAEILEFFESDEDSLLSLLKHTNNDMQNVFHLAGRHCNNEIDEVLDEYQHLVSNAEVSVSDRHGNTPIHYLSGTQKIKAYAGHLMRLPLTKRREIIMLTYNRKMLNAQQVLDGVSSASPQSLEEFFLQSVIDFSQAMYGDVNTFYEYRRGFTKSQPYYNITLDPRLLKVNAYALNMYSLTDVASTSLLQPDAAHCKQKLDGVWLFIDDALIENDDLQSLQDNLASLDTEYNSGKPKIVLQRKISRKLNLYPPGPEYIIITAESPDGEHIDPNQSSWPEESLPTSDIKSAIDYLRFKENVSQVTVNSTLGRHHVSSSEGLFSDDPKQQQLITGSNRGRALIICNKDGRMEWEYQYKDAKYIMEHQFGLKATEKFDLTASQMLEEIEGFVNSADHGQMVALVIQAHGDTLGNISGVDSKPAAVQDIIDAFCSRDLEHIPKVALLSFCRGGIPPKYNRMPKAFESDQLRKIVQSSDYSPTRGPLPTETLKSVHSSHPFPHVTMPPDCYVFYTTLPDSKSLRDSIVFQEMRGYISTLHYLTTKVWDHSSSSASDREEGGRTDVLTPLKKRLKLTSHAQVEIIALFTDVAALTKEKSQHKVYTNHCYTLNKSSKTVVIDVNL